MSAEKIAAIKAKRLAKKRTTIKVDDELDAGVLVSWPDRIFSSSCSSLDNIREATQHYLD
jgi:hypothetical protein